VEAVLDAALALEQHIDVYKGLDRERFPEYVPEETLPVSGTFRTRYDRLSGETAERETMQRRRRTPIPPAPESDLLWFIARYAPELEDWERDIFLAVRKESFYFYPVFACQIMNEGWASFWQAKLLREADFLPQDLYLDAIKAHSDVVRPYAGERQVALSINPYHLGFVMWEHIVEHAGREQAGRIMREDDDFSFIRNHLDEGLAEKLGLFEYLAESDGRIEVKSKDLDGIREQILARKFNFGAPAVSVSQVHVDGALELDHDHRRDGRGLDRARAERVLEYIHRVWRRPVRLQTVDGAGAAATIEVDERES
jgi:stage V sporulation protein R